MLEDLPLDPAVHDRRAFECGVPALDEYIGRFADQHRKRGTSSVYVLAESTQPERILGNDTLGAAEIDAQRLPDAERKKLPRYPVPMLPHGAARLPVGPTRTRSRQVIAGLLRRSLLEGQAAGCGPRVDRGCEDESAKALYQHFGFTAMLDETLTLYLPLGR